MVGLSVLGCERPLRVFPAPPTGSRCGSYPRWRNLLLSRLSSTPSRSSRVPKAGKVGCERHCRQLEQHRWQSPDPIPRGRVERLLLAARRIEDDLDAQLAGTAAYEEFRVTGRDTRGRFGHPPNPYVPPTVPDAMVSVTDPDSRHIKATEAYVRGYNPQAVVDENQIVLAAEITNSTVHFSQLDPMITAALCELDGAGVTARPEIAVADAQYWNEQHMDEVIANKHIQVLIPPDSGAHKTPRPGWTGGRYTAMRNALASPAGKELYRRLQTDDRASVRSHQARPPSQPVPARRSITDGQDSYRLAQATAGKGVKPLT